MTALTGGAQLPSAPHTVILRRRHDSEGEDEDVPKPKVAQQAMTDGRLSGSITTGVGPEHKKAVVLPMTFVGSGRNGGEGSAPMEPAGPAESTVSTLGSGSCVGEVQAGMELTS